MTPSEASEQVARRNWWGIVGAAIFGIIAIGVGASLGSWQWDRAHQQSAPVEPDPRAPLAQVMKPAQPGIGEGRLVVVTGTWADQNVAVVAGKEVDGIPAVLLIRALTVPTDQTGTGAGATLAVLAGWLPADAELPLPAVGDTVTITGYVRGGEGAAPAPENEEIDGVTWVGALSTATLAQQWPSPVYSYLVVDDSTAPGWRALPPPEPERRLDLRSVTYAVEWWLFGAFGAFIAARFIRDNVRSQTPKEHS